MSLNSRQRSNNLNFMPFTIRSTVSWKVFREGNDCNKVKSLFSISLACKSYSVLSKFVVSFETALFENNKFSRVLMKAFILSFYWPLTCSNMVATFYLLALLRELKVIIENPFMSLVSLSGWTIILATLIALLIMTCEWWYFSNFANFNSC